MTSVIELLRSHRSIRSFKDEKISEELLMGILSAGSDFKFDSSVINN